MSTYPPKPATNVLHWWFVWSSADRAEYRAGYAYALFCMTGPAVTPPGKVFIRQTAVQIIDSLQFTINGVGRSPWTDGAMRAAQEAR